MTKQPASLSIGDTVPDFDIPATDGANISRSSLKGSPFVLYFYPKDDTPGCTAESCDFRDSLQKFNQAKVKIIGISKDSIAAHDKFRAKYELNFPLASDEKSDMCERFGVWVEKNMYGKKYWGIERTTFLINSDGVIQHIWHKVNVKGHVDEVLDKVNGKIK